MRRITKGFYIRSIFIIILIFLKLLDIILTIIGINSCYNLHEINPLGVLFIYNPVLLISSNIFAYLSFIIINIIFWILNGKSGILFKITLWIFNIILLIVIGTNSFAVINNIIRFYEVLK
jgi:hypothetical protein